MLRNVGGLIAEERPQRIGLDHTGRHAVDANATRRELARKITHQRFRERLGDADGGVVGNDGAAAPARQEKDRAAAREQRIGRLHEIEQRRAVEIDGGGEVVRVAVEGGLGDGAHGAVHELVEPVDLLRGLGQHGTSTLRRPDVLLDQVTARARRLDQRVRLARRLVVAPIVEKHVRAGFGEAQRDGASDALGPARDQDRHDTPRYASPTDNLPDKWLMLTRNIIARAS